MTHTQFNVFRDSFGNLTIHNYTETVKNSSWEQFLSDTNQNERLEALQRLSSRKRSPKVYRIRHSEAFKAWQVGKDIRISCNLYGVASCEYDGRIPEDYIQWAIVAALRENRHTLEYYPKSNTRKPSHHWRVYTKNFIFTPAE